MWSFSINKGWEKIDDFLSNEKECNSFEEELDKSYYHSESSFILGSSTHGVEVEVYKQKNRPVSLITNYSYIVLIDLKGIGDVVAIPELPDLLELTSKLVPTIEALITPTNEQK